MKKKKLNNRLKRISFISSLLLASTTGLSSVSYTEELKGTAFLETNYLKLKDDGNKKENINEKYTVNIWKNKEKQKNIKYYEELKTLDVNKNSIGLLATGENVKIINKGDIVVNNGGIGMTVTNNALMLNDQQGEIKLDNENATGMFAEGTSIGNNSGIISLIKGNNYRQAGMTSEDGGTSINNGEIFIKSNHSYGIFIKNNSNNLTTGVNSGNIALENTSGSIAMEVVGDLSVGVNKSNISINGATNSTGMVSAQGGVSTNKGIIKLNNSIESKGMNIGDGNSVSNTATKVVNDGNIELTNTTKNSFGMRVSEDYGLVMDSGIAENNGLLSIDGTFNIGMYSNGVATTIINNKNISLKDTAKNSFGMTAFNGATGVNNGEIELGTSSGSGNMGIQIVGPKTIGVNNGKIIVNSINQVGINSTQGGIALNKGVIEVNNMIERDNPNSYAITVGSNSSIINEGSINITGQGAGIVSERIDDTAVNITNTSTGNININGNESLGISVENDSSVTNEGVIDISGNQNYGIYATNANNVVISKDKSEIKMSGNNNFGIASTSISKESSSVTNKGNIIMIGDENNGILASNSIVLNDGEINLNGDNNTGISLSDSIVTNNGNININGDNNTGIYATGNSKVYNDGVITIEGKGNTGIAIEAGASLSNTGKIIIEGKEYTGSYNTSTDAQGNTAIINYGEIINKGEIITSGEFDVSQMGSGILIMDKDSTLKADAIKGDIYLSGGIATGTIEDEYSTYKMFNTDEMKANLLSSSLLFDTKLVLNENNYYDVILTRRNFNEVINDNNLANFLETNYKNTDNKDKVSFYDKFKLISSNQQMNYLVDDTFGRTLFPTLQKQTFEMIRLNDNILRNNVSKESMNEEFKYIVGGAYNRIDSDSSKNTQGYISSLKNVWLGGEKRINNNLKAGIILSVGEHSSNFTNNSNREDTNLQGTFFMNYNKDDLNIRSFATIGGLKSDLTRESTTYNETLDSEFNSRYFVFSNEISKLFNFEKNMYVSPKASLNLYKIRQDTIREDNGQYGLEIDKVEGFIIEPGIGFVLGKNTYLNNGYNLNTELEFNYFYKDGDLNNDLNGKIKSISDDSFTLQGYDFEKKSGDGKIKVSLEKENWDVYASYQLIFENKISNISTLGVSYKFN